MNLQQEGCSGLSKRTSSFLDDKQKLKEHRYRWARRIMQPGPTPVLRWALLDPQGQELSKEQALRDIDIAESPEPDDYPIH